LTEEVVFTGNEILEKANEELTSFRTKGVGP
jgi:hypothetical protein